MRSIDYFEQRKDARKCIKEVKQQTFAFVGMPVIALLLGYYFPEWEGQSAIPVSPSTLLIIAAVLLTGGLIRIEIIRSDWRRINAMLHNTERREGRRYTTVDDIPLVYPYE